MRNVVLFIAMSLDGYIADVDGGVGWLAGQCNESENGDSYSEFTKTIDTVVMGWKTYYQVSTELSPSEWVYRDFRSYVITHNPQKPTENIQFTCASPSELIRRLRKEPGKDIWICGGASIVQQLMRDSLIDQFHISVIPTVLGSGVRLFGTLDWEMKLKLTESRSCDGIVEVVYEKR